MSGSARQVYLLAKMYGVVARSWLGANLRDILKLKSLTDLHGLLWPSAPGEAAELPSVVDMEVRLLQDAVAALEAVLDGLGEPPALLVHMLRRVEYRNLKIALRSLSAGTEGDAARRKDVSRFVDLGRYAALRLHGAQDVEKALRASPYDWTIESLRGASRARVECEIDRRYYAELLRLVRGLPQAERTVIQRFVTAEVTLSNAVWALRLRFSYGMDAAAALPLLIPGGGSVAHAALARAFEIPADAMEEWRRWRYGWLLEDQLGESFKGPDPVAAEARATQRLFLRAHQLLHQYPFTIAPFVAYFALKLQEASFLTSAVEAVALGVPEKEALALAVVPVAGAPRLPQGGAS